jgi:DNA-binding protein H-NS
MEARDFDRLTTKISSLDIVDLQKVIDHAQATLVEKREESRQNLTSEVEEKIRAAGFDPAEFLGGKKPAQTPGQKMAAKYRNPENPDQTWGGRGKRPNWIQNALASGKKLDEMLIPGGGGIVGTQKAEDTKAA